MLPNETHVDPEICKQGRRDVWNHVERCKRGKYSGWFQEEWGVTWGHTPVAGNGSLKGWTLNSAAAAVAPVTAVILQAARLHSDKEALAHVWVGNSPSWTMPSSLEGVEVRNVLLAFVISFCVINNFRVWIVGIQLFYKRQISAEKTQSFFISKYIRLS